MSGYCSLHATSVPSGRRARCTWPSEAAAAASWLNVAKRDSQFGPSSAAMRRRTKGQPIGGEFESVFGGEHVRDGGQELRHLHQRAFQSTQDGAQVFRMRGAVGLDAEHALAGQARGDAADRT